MEKSGKKMGDNRGKLTPIKIDGKNTDIYKDLKILQQQILVPDERAKSQRIDPNKKKRSLMDLSDNGSN